MKKDDELSVLIITQFFPPESMGGAHRWEKLCQNLDEDISPHVLCPPATFPFGAFDRTWKPYKRDEIRGIPVTRLWTFQPKKNGSSLGRILNYGIFTVVSTIYVLMNWWRYDCVVTMSAPHTTFVPGLLAKLMGRQWLLDIFDLWIDNAADLGYVEANSFEYQIIAALEQLSFNMADGVLVITDTMGEYYEEKYEKVDFDIHVVPFGVDTEKFSPAKETSFNTDVIYTGNLGTGQAFIPFIKAFARLEAETELTVVGDGERRNELERLVRNEGIADRVSFLGYVNRDKVPELIAGANISLVPLKTEFQLDYARPTKLLETMAVGTPYVASAVTEIKKTSQKNNTGIAVENEVEELSNAMETLLMEKDKREKMGQNGVQVISKNHDWGNIGKDVSLIIRNNI